MSSLTVSSSPSSYSWINESAFQEDDDAEHGSSIESDDDHNVIFAPTPPEVVLVTPLSKKITTQDYVLYGIFTLEEVESPRFPPTPVGYGESTPVYRRPQPTELTFRTELHKIYLELFEQLTRPDRELLCYSPSQRKTLINQIKLLRLNMQLTDTTYYKDFYRVVQNRFNKPIFKDYFPKDCECSDLFPNRSL